MPATPTWILDREPFDRPGKSGPKRNVEINGRACMRKDVQRRLAGLRCCPAHDDSLSLRNGGARFGDPRSDAHYARNGKVVVQDDGVGDSPWCELACG
jgi:hypothetical protein